MTGQDLCREAEARLSAAGVISARADAQILFLHAIGRISGSVPPRHALRDHLAAPASDAVAACYADMISARAGRQPVSQIIGFRSFWKHDFRVTRDTLDPRPETELLVELALSVPFGSVLDLGTGTGAILISVLAERPQAFGVGADLSSAALDVARGNAQMIGVRPELVVSNWYDAVTGRFDLILSNPPYIALGEMPDLSPEVRDWEPWLALTDHGDGLSAYRAICAGVQDHLNPGGWLMVEIGFTQGAAVAALLDAAGLVDVAIRQDLGGRDRVVLGRRPGVQGA
ncbi:peptide chain release factor N(5)-glutamine methyltransferase [Paracoccus ravus]|uniref:peptide chain release factor N(5)-glutamine methyltransferase n=1 Tax=Paracoccus ravus TaxID=2447760 RepID=UPI003CC859A7